LANVLMLRTPPGAPKLFWRPIKEIPSFFPTKTSFPLPSQIPSLAKRLGLPFPWDSGSPHPHPRKRSSRAPFPLLPYQRRTPPPHQPKVCSPPSTPPSSPPAGRIPPNGREAFSQEQPQRSKGRFSFFLEPSPFPGYIAFWLISFGGCSPIPFQLVKNLPRRPVARRPLFSPARPGLIKILLQKVSLPSASTLKIRQLPPTQPIPFTAGEVSLSPWPALFSRLEPPRHSIAL